MEVLEGRDGDDGVSAVDFYGKEEEGLRVRMIRPSQMRRQSLQKL